LIPEFIKAKKGGKVKYLHPLLEEISAETYGVLIYQEQVMAAANRLAGYSLGQSDLLRRAMGKKDKAKMAQERESFTEGCARTNKIPEKKANAIFDVLERFAGYGFNKSHSAAYGVISYQTAYLKAHYPVEFMSGLLSNEINHTDKISIFVGECKRMGIPILPPDMNRSGLKFTPEAPVAGDAIRYGLAAIKNVGEGAMVAAIAERKRGGDFTSLEDFCSRLDSRVANRKIVENLVKAGAFDFLGRRRAELFACIEETLAASAASHRDRAVGQVSLFGDLPPAAISRATSDYTPWSDRETLSFEKELLGFYVTGHPLDAYAGVFAQGKYLPIVSLGELADRATFTIAGAIAQVDRKFTKKEGKPFAVVFLEDLSGILEVVLWNESYVPVSQLLEPGTVIAIRGTLDKRDDNVRATAQKVKVLKADLTNASPGNGAESNGSGRVKEESPLTLRFGAGIAAQDLLTVRQILASSPGSQPVTLMMRSEDGRTVQIEAGNMCRVEFTPAIARQLAPWL
ncbi:MAG: OB-fold nucleic acid binding domain-containing protein, partial [Chthoniobacterales bacterium]